MAKGDTIGGLVVFGAILGGFAMMAGAGSSSVSATTMSDYIVGRIFYILAIFESSVDFGAWGIRKNTRLRFGWEVSYGVLQSRAEIGMLEIVNRYLKLCGIAPSKVPNQGELSRLSDHTFIIYKMVSLIPERGSSVGQFNEFIRQLDRPHLTYNKARRMTLKQAMTFAGRSDKRMRQAQVEYFMKHYLQPAFTFCDQNNLKFPVSKLIAAGATLLNGFAGFKSKVKPFLRGGDELTEMSAFANHLLQTMNKATGMNVSYRAQTYLFLLKSNPNLAGAIKVKGNTVPLKVTLQSLIDGGKSIKNQSLEESAFMDDMDAPGGDYSYADFQENGDYGDMDAGYSYADFDDSWSGDPGGDYSYADFQENGDYGDMDAGYSYADFQENGDYGDYGAYDDVGQTVLAQIPHVPQQPLWYRGPGYYVDAYGRWVWVA